MEIKSAIDMVQSYLYENGAASDTFQAWHTLRAKLLVGVANNGTQQLKAEIAALINDFDTPAHLDGSFNLRRFINQLRQLSAVYQPVAATISL